LKESEITKAKKQIQIKHETYRSDSFVNMSYDRMRITIDTTNKYGRHILRLLEALNQR